MLLLRFVNHALRGESSAHLQLRERRQCSLGQRLQRLDFREAVLAEVENLKKRETDGCEGLEMIVNARVHA